MTTLRSLWEQIPVPVRTIINVVAGAAFAALVAYLTGVVSGGTFDLSAAWQAVLVAASTALVRAINPLDTGYGVKPVLPAPTGDVQDS